MLHIYRDKAANIDKKDVEDGDSVTLNDESANPVDDKKAQPTVFQLLFMQHKELLGNVMHDLVCRILPLVNLYNLMSTVKIAIVLDLCYTKNNEALMYN